MALQNINLQDYFDQFPNNEFLFRNSNRQLSLLAPLVKQYIRGESVKIILDIASGSGGFSEAIEGICTQASYFLLDLSKNSLARSKYVNRIQADAQHTPFRSNCADLLLCRQGLHYMSLPASLAEFRRILKLKGLLLVSTEWWIDGSESKEEKRWINSVFSSRNKPAGNLIDKNQLLNLLQENNFELMFHSLNFEKQKVPVSKWIELYDNEIIKFSEIRKSILDFSPINSSEKGYPHLVNGNVEYVSKWMTVLCSLENK